MENAYGLRLNMKGYLLSTSSVGSSGMIIDGESKMHKSYFVHMGHPWEKTGEMGRVEHTRHRQLRSSLIKDGRAYWTLRVEHARPQ